jgi:hypothetical protein
LFEAGNGIAYMGRVVDRFLPFLRKGKILVRDVIALRFSDFRHAIPMSRRLAESAAKRTISNSRYWAPKPKQ